MAVARLPAQLFAFAICAVLAGCEDEREECDAALDVICNCATRPCDSDHPPEIVLAMQRCKDGDVRPDDQEGNVHLCIDDANSAFCAVLDGLTWQSQNLCEADCDLYAASCTVALERACYDYQFSSCDIPDTSR